MEIISIVTLISLFCFPPFVFIQAATIHIVSNSPYYSAVREEEGGGSSPSAFSLLPSPFLPIAVLLLGLVVTHQSRQGSLCILLNESMFAPPSIHPQESPLTKKIKH